ncbi:hypothetical protein C731_0515 [Mycolicibacterium hassiacum DSM 44199]|jgi:hypothetical protein|uniref:Uncharacterized protein n=1 Tax=Mycolicibacterium hassiacum (strain DSM 44199 / CIP 105218 / JCM 12690 / 3849) TaxID=1122247 RepID=K5BH65_MYCHD|nr:IniB N-terminal domain-containing protein [Mycolicibacterium hassiacum]EKF25402.1 hypothetical protein C731_0515 [Mycolicibacterium hassiacum DSM 44199]MDA4086111.1 hypothetical protein [Mycolicibacterium hassiacum DSM 44199]PZN22165.1 MAG: hypothetical protein DIU75_08405 [Mycolicibacterium hassiacum]VCT92929.1 Isoniazid-induced protein IniB [Mycolicibacterium hassiacum DSM 44199]
MTNVIDWILSLFRDPVKAQAFIADPGRAMQSAGITNLTTAQVQSVAASVAPAAVVKGGGDPVVGLQQAVAQTHGIAFAPQRQTEAFSNNDTLSHNDTRFLSPETNTATFAGQDVQQGGVNVGLDFGDITFGNKTTNTATEGAVINTGNAGDIDTTHVDGDGNVVGDGNENVNTGDIKDSNVNIGGLNNKIDDRGDITAGGDVIKDNKGPVVNDVDMSGGDGGSARGGDGPGGLIGVGKGGDATAGSGGSGGVLVISDNSHTHNEVDGNMTTVGDVHGDLSGSVTGGYNKEDNSVDNSVNDSFNQDNRVTDSFNTDNRDYSEHDQVSVNTEVSLW